MQAEETAVRIEHYPMCANADASSARERWEQRLRAWVAVAKACEDATPTFSSSMRTAMGYSSSFVLFASAMANDKATARRLSCIGGRNVASSSQMEGEGK